MKHKLTDEERLARVELRAFTALILNLGAMGLMLLTWFAINRLGEIPSWMLK